MKENLANKSNNILIISFLAVFIAFTLVIYLFYLKPQLTYNKSNYIPTKKRNNYIIQDLSNISLNSYISKNTNTLIVFFATWCSSCVEESNDLNNFIVSHPEIPVIVVSHDKTKEKLEEYLKENNFNWFVILDSKRDLRASIDDDTKGIPASYLLDKDLNIISKEITQMSEDDFYNFYNLNFNK